MSPSFYEALFLWVIFSCKIDSTFTNVSLFVPSSVCLFVLKTPQQLEIIILHLSSFIILQSSFNHPSSFFINPSFILRLLRFSACFFLNFPMLVVVITIIKIYLALYLKKCFLEGVWDPPFFLVFAIWPLKLCLCAVVL